MTEAAPNHTPATFPTSTVSELVDSNITKRDAFDSLNVDFDCTLPQQWLDSVTSFAIARGLLNVSYDLIRSTTVWVYSDNYVGPLSCCLEVAEVIKQYNSQTGDETMSDFGLIDDNARFQGQLLSNLLGFELKQLLLKSPHEFTVDAAGNVTLLDSNNPATIYQLIGE